MRIAKTQHVARPKLALVVTILALALTFGPSAALGKALGAVTPRLAALACENTLLGPGYLRTLKENIFIVSRNLHEYGRAFGENFDSRLVQLSREQVWIDFGAGEARAQLDFLQKNRHREHAQTLAIALSYPKKADSEYVGLLAQFEGQERFRYLEGRLVENIGDAEIGLFDLGTDYFGPITYSLKLSEVLNKYLRLMRAVGSQVFFVTSEAPDKGAWVETRTGERLTLGQWLGTQPGIQLRVLSNSGGGNEVAFELTKTTAYVELPGLDLVEYEKNGRGLVVARVFRERRLN